ncbi:putative nacht and tpr domain protein [Botrytis fragariae]|uniref:Putative nacht and tpr domain protein n=1 Tax=Botrytis fragariae TaxID=1964551 RepID=A0A8H6ASZ0_9HELO|nr:putative nacht and tpr domain protein [Botrytis fragariae]KAF5873099.1 putative nacht and tpr domain protein [Botrytis fragariae]
MMRSGGCGKKQTYADNFHVCKSCSQRIFCGDYLQKPRRNRLKTWACYPEHTWLHVPPYNGKHLAGKGTVRVTDESDNPEELKINY